MSSSSPRHAPGTPPAPPKRPPPRRPPNAPPPRLPERPRPQPPERQARIDCGQVPVATGPQQVVSSETTGMAATLPAQLPHQVNHHQVPLTQQAQSQVYPRSPLLGKRAASVAQPLPATSGEMCKQSLQQQQTPASRSPQVERRREALRQQVSIISCTNRPGEESSTTIAVGKDTYTIGKLQLGEGLE